MSVSEPRNRDELAREYSAALVQFLSGGGEEALTRAYELGRKAMSLGVTLLDVALLHHESLRSVMAGARTDGAQAWGLAAEFLTESLSPFEMSLRAYRDNARLLGLSENLAQSNVELDRARGILQTILDATTAIIYMKDAGGAYVFVNHRFETVFGRPREEVIGRTDAEALPPTIGEILSRSDTRVLSAKTPQELEEDLPANEGWRTYISLKFPLVDADGEAYALCSVLTDISERKRADEALRRAKDQAESANRELEAFSYSVAHDLRAPLRSIDGFSQILLEDFSAKLDDDAKKYLRFVREGAKQMAQLIDDLLTLSRVTRAELRREPVDLASLARASFSKLLLVQPRRQVEFRIQDGIGSCEGDPHLLGVAFDNLLGNAWKFTGKTEHPRIEVGSTATERAERTYFVRDNGAGFDMAYERKLFGVFQRLHSAAEFEGTGVGLATVQRIIHRHGGRVWAKGEVGQGATFFFTLGGEPPG